MSISKEWPHLGVSFFRYSSVRDRRSGVAVPAAETSRASNCIDLKTVPVGVVLFGKS